MGDFVFDALFNPSGHNRSVQNPIADFHGTNGVSHDLGLPIPEGLGPTTTKYDNGLNYNNGVNSTNQPITKQFAMRETAVFNSKHCGTEQPVFMSGSTSNQQIEVTHNIVSVYALNFYLQSEQGREKYSNDNLFSLFNRDWMFGGVMKSKESIDSLINTNSRYVTITVGKRAQMPDIFRTIKNTRENRKGTVSDNDVVWLIPRRYEDKHVRYPVYTQIDCYATRSHQAPSIALTSGWLTNGSYWITSPIRMGYVSLVHGSRAFNDNSMQTARKVMKGSGGDDSKRWEDLQSLGGRVELMLGTGL